MYASDERLALRPAVESTMWIASQLPVISAQARALAEVDPAADWGDQEFTHDEAAVTGALVELRAVEARILWQRDQWEAPLLPVLRGEDLGGVPSGRLVAMRAAARVLQVAGADHRFADLMVLSSGTLVDDVITVLEGTLGGRYEAAMEIFDRFSSMFSADHALLVGLRLAGVAVDEQDSVSSRRAALFASGKVVLPAFMRAYRRPGVQEDECSVDHLLAGLPLPELFTMPVEQVTGVCIRALVLVEWGVTSNPQVAALGEIALRELIDHRFPPEAGDSYRRLAAAGTLDPTDLLIGVIEELGALPRGTPAAAGTMPGPRPVATMPGPTPVATVPGLPATTRARGTGNGASEPRGVLRRPA